MFAEHRDTPTNSASAAVHVQPSCYLEAPALADVVNEQMSYLLAHAGHNTAGCPDCQRLSDVVRLLMRPFE